MNLLKSLFVTVFVFAAKLVIPFDVANFLARKNEYFSNLLPFKDILTIQNINVLPTSSYPNHSLPAKELSFCKLLPFPKSQYAVLFPFLRARR